MELFIWLARVVHRLFIAQVAITEALVKVHVLIIENSGLELTRVLLLTTMTHALTITVFCRGALDASSIVSATFSPEVMTMANSGANN